MNITGEEVFNRDFFDGGHIKPWLYKSYIFEELLPLLRLVVWAVSLQFNPGNILDVGCAKGFLVKALMDAGIDAYGVDISDYALSNAPPEIKPHIFKIDLNHENLPFPDGYFDCVTFLGTIECLDDHDSVIREIYRVTRTGGGLYLRTTYKTSTVDPIRKNVHSRGYWLKEFRDHGFKFLPSWSGPLANQWSYGTLLFERN